MQLGGDEAVVAEAVQQALTDPCMLSTATQPSAADVAALYAAAMDDAALYPAKAEPATATARL
eukprot:SAG11_NODE_3950_length_2136_cov_2.977909_2_plen_63_part_00